MKIAVVTWSCRKLGGAETYLDMLMPALARAGHQVAFVAEVDVPANIARMGVLNESAAWCAAAIGAGRAVDEARRWQPDVIYSQGLLTPEFELATLGIAPAVLFAHGYYGTCISGRKSFAFPRLMPCSRRFGWRCLAHFYPHRCGGLSPLSMWRDYRRQAARLTLLRRYRAIVVASDHMRSEYVRHGLEPDQVQTAPYPVANRSIPSFEPSAAGLRRSSEVRLLFLGRMVIEKGGGLLLDALPALAVGLRRRVRMIFAGDGPDRVRLEEKAARLQAGNAAVAVEFTGQLPQDRVGAFILEADLLVVPSLWSEPFGLVGPEAGLLGVPAAAFAVGGIPEWLIDGVNGYLAPGDHPTVEGLAGAILKCLVDPVTYSRLRRGAIEMAQTFTMERHLGLLEPVLENAAGTTARVGS